MEPFRFGVVLVKKTGGVGTQIFLQLTLHFLCFRLTVGTPPHMLVRLIVTRSLHSHCPSTQLAREICLHIRIVHPHVVALYVAWKDSKYVYLALEWAPQVTDGLGVEAVGRGRVAVRGCRCRGFVMPAWYWKWSGTCGTQSVRRGTSREWKSASQN